MAEKTKKQRILGSIAAFNTILERYPKLLTWELENGVETTFSAINFLMDILGLFGITEEVIIEWLVKLISGTNENGVEKGILFAINEAINALSFYDTKIAAVATNGEFTKTARQRQEELIANGYSLKLWNGAFLQSLIENMPSDHASYRSLRPYQDKIVEKVMASYESGSKRSFYIVATGLGKTVIAATIARKLWEKGCKKILVLCHAIDLALQLEQGFWPQLTKDVPTSVFFDGLPPRNAEGISFGLYHMPVKSVNRLSGQTVESFRFLNSTALIR